MEDDEEEEDGPGCEYSSYVRAVELRLRLKRADEADGALARSVAMAVYGFAVLSTNQHIMLNISRSKRWF